MTEINLPLSITYQTEGVTPIADVIEALKATDNLTREAVALLPSLLDGLQIDGCSLNVRSISQESPLREIFLVSLIAVFQSDLKEEVPPMIEDLFGVQVSDKYDTIVTIVFMIVLFYGISFAIDAAQRTFANSKSKRTLSSLIADAAQQTGKTEDEVRAILDAHFNQPKGLKRLVGNAVSFFRPSQKDANAPILIDRHDVDRETVQEVPYPKGDPKPKDFDRYEQFEHIELELHATDKDKAATGWAAVAPEISDGRLKLKLIDPVQPNALWGRDSVVGSGVVVQKLTSDGYRAAELHLTSIDG